MGAAALAANAALAWRDAAEDAVEVMARVGGAELAVRLRFDAAGDVVASSAQRPRQAGRQTVVTAWGGEFGDYTVVGGVSIPTRAEVYWDLPEGRFAYFRGRVTALSSR